jgi:hypothetical protein
MYKILRKTMMICVLYSTRVSLFLQLERLFFINSLQSILVVNFVLDQRQLIWIGGSNLISLFYTVQTWFIFHELFAHACSLTLCSAMNILKHTVWRVSYYTHKIFFHIWSSLCRDQMTWAGRIRGITWTTQIIWRCVLKKVSIVRILHPDKTEIH